MYAIFTLFLVAFYAFKKKNSNKLQHFCIFSCKFRKNVLSLHHKTKNIV